MFDGSIDFDVVIINIVDSVFVKYGWYFFFGMIGFIKFKGVEFVWC